MMRTVLSLILFLFTYTFAFAADNHDALWQKANKLYEQKSYDSAAYYYQQIAALKPAEAVVYFNLGNAHYKLNEIGLAVLNYQRALARNPSYKEAADNLALAESRITNRIPVAPKIFFVQWWQSLTSSSTAGTWAIVSVISFLLLIGFAICKRLGIIKASVPPQALGIAWTLCFCFLLFAFIAAENRRTRDKAVVMQNDTPVYSAPATAKSITAAPEGTTITFDKEQDGWMEITLPDGRSGWMRSSDVSKI